MRTQCVIPKHSLLTFLQFFFSFCSLALVSSQFKLIYWRRVTMVFVEKQSFVVTFPWKNVKDLLINHTIPRCKSQWLPSIFPTSTIQHRRKIRKKIVLFSVSFLSPSTFMKSSLLVYFETCTLRPPQHKSLIMNSLKVSGQHCAL